MKTTNVRRQEAHPCATTYTAGIDLHSNNMVLAIVDHSGKRVKHAKLPCNLGAVLNALEPFKEKLQSVAVESTFNWYWLVDGLKEHGYPVVLANPAAIKQYEGVKHADDKNDAFFLAELLRLGILPTGYIYEPAVRPVRDLLRRRLGLVRQRTALWLSFKSLYCRTTGETLPLNRLKGMGIQDASNLYEHPANQLIASLQNLHITALSQSIGIIENEVLKSARKIPHYQQLKTLPGIGVILALTITMETGPIERFKTPGDFASYCRTVDSKRISNGRKKGDNNQKCGNKFLAWAFVEAANFAKRSDQYCRRWFDRKAARTSTIVATKALACKLAKAAWHVMSAETGYDEKRMFPELAGALKQISGEQSASQSEGLALSPED